VGIAQLGNCKHKFLTIFKVHLNLLKVVKVQLYIQKSEVPKSSTKQIPKKKAKPKGHYIALVIISFSISNLLVSTNH
jgi:hypothetical protein